MNGRIERELPIPKVDPFSLPPILDDEQVIAHLRAMFVAAEAAEKRRTRNRKVLALFLFLTVITVAGFVVRYYR